MKKIRWKKWYYEPDLFGKPLAKGGALNCEGQAVFEKIAEMPQAKPITVKELDLEFGDLLSRSTPMDAVWLCNVGPIFWAAWMGYHIVYSREDYELIEVEDDAA